MLFAAIYRGAQETMSFLSFYPEFQGLLLPVIPRALQSVLAGLGDFFTWRLASNLYGVDSTASWAALWMTILNPWQWYCSTRTFSNSLETTLTIAALHYWPWTLFADASARAEKVFAKPGSVAG
jgi:phosphatidylinositol glycan class B